MNSATKRLMAIALFNLFIILMFPPYDDMSISNRGTAIFYGFVFFLQASQRLVLNHNLLILELIVLAVNVGIFWVLSNPGKRRMSTFKGNLRAIALIVVAINLIGILLFPPFEFISNVTKAVIPTFEGFYFIFNHPPYRTIVIPILYLELILVLVNGGLVLLLFKGKATK